MKSGELEDEIVAAWELGLLQWKLDSNQLTMHEALHTAWEREIVHTVNASRQLGKSYWLVTEALMFAIQNPGSQIKYAAPTAKMVRKILRPHFRELCDDCPASVRPRWHSQDGEYRFPNGSVITVAGCDRDNAETLRGQHADLAIVDEGGAIDELNYVVNDILVPQTLNTGGRVIIVSTPAKTPGHAFKDYCDRAEERGVLIFRTIYDNPRLTAGRIEQLKREAGGDESTTWKREYLCQHVTDESLAVFPEATRVKMDETIIAVDALHPRAYRPQFFDTYTIIDLGWSPDYTGILFGYVDFEKSELIGERDFIMRRMKTSVLAAYLKEQWKDLWGLNSNQSPFMCIGDVDPRTQSTLATDHGIVVTVPDKENKDAAINDVRQMIIRQKHGMRTHPELKKSRRQLSNAIWNNTRTKFARNEVDGHYDLADCWIYWRRHALLHRNPVPDGYGINRGTMLVIPTDPPISSTATAFKKVFKFGRRR